MVFFLLQSVQSVVGRASYDFVGAPRSFPSRPSVRSSTRPCARQPTHSREHTFIPQLFYVLLFVGVVYSSRAWTVGYDNTAVFDFIFRHVWFDFRLESVPHLKLEIDVRFPSPESRITLISSESGGRIVSMKGRGRAGCCESERWLSKRADHDAPQVSDLSVRRVVALSSRQRPVQIGQQEAECQNATGAADTDDFAMLLLADARAADTIYEV